MHTWTRFLAVPLAAALLAGCSSAATTAPTAAPASAAATGSVAPASPGASAAAASIGASMAPAASSAASPGASAVAISPSCMKGQVATLASGKLTIGTDNPAYPPYFATDSGTPPKPWKLGDPTNGQGFESAVAYAVAGQLGFGKSDVVWTVVPFDNSYAPGPKPFDFYLAQVSYTPERAQAVDMSDGYYYVAQSVVALKGNPITAVTTIAGLKSFRLGAMQGTTAYAAIKNVVAPTAPISVYSSNDAAIEALKAKQIDGIVTDLPTAFYITAAQLDNSVIVGQFPVTPGPNAEHFSLVLAKGSPLTACVNQAISALKADGTLAQITKEWLSDKASAPVLQP
ncbi:MAG: ABC transporter substrate-binding protein [Candidatus Limnocylindrales bacterium]